MGCFGEAQDAADLDYFRLTCHVRRLHPGLFWGSLQKPPQQTEFDSDSGLVRVKGCLFGGGVKVHIWWLPEKSI